MLTCQLPRVSGEKGESIELLFDDDDDDDAYEALLKVDHEHTRKEGACSSFARFNRGYDADCENEDDHGCCWT